jgi:hypothetical protein
VLLCLGIQRNELQVQMILNILFLLFYFSILKQQSERSAFLFQFEKDLLLLRFPTHLLIEFSWNQEELREESNSTEKVLLWWIFRHCKASLTKPAFHHY